MSRKKTVVVGASENPARYANRAAKMLLQYGHPVELIGLREGKIGDEPIQAGTPELHDIDTVTIYVGPQHQEGYYDYIRELKPNRVIFNPGAENPDFARQLAADGIDPINACTLVMLSVGTY